MKRIKLKSLTPEISGLRSPGTRFSEAKRRPQAGAGGSQKAFGRRAEANATENKQKKQQATNNQLVVKPTDFLIK